jgi:hypothetical protein
MRKFILISVFILASATAQAGQPRGLTVAANDTPNSDERIESTQPAPAQADVTPEASKPATTDAAKPVTEVAKPATEPAKPVKTASSKPAHKFHEQNYASEEARARSIAARYGVSW